MKERNKLLVPDDETHEEKIESECDSSWREDNDNTDRSSAETVRFRGGSRDAATSKMEYFVIIVNGFQPLTIITKHSILDVAAALDLPLCFHEIFKPGN